VSISMSISFVHRRLCMHHKALWLVIGNMKRGYFSLFIVFNQRIRAESMMRNVQCRKITKEVTCCRAW
jgi:hypothetical protein